MKKFCYSRKCCIFVLSMMIATAVAGVDKERDNKRLTRETTKFSVWERCVQSCNTKFFDICEGNKLERQ